VILLPEAESDKELANNFLVYFKEKIEKILSSFTPLSERVCACANPNIVKLTELEPTTLVEITEIPESYGVECSHEDPVPASLLSASIDTFAPFWLEIVNLSLQKWWWCISKSFHDADVAGNPYMSSPMYDSTQQVICLPVHYELNGFGEEQIHSTHTRHNARNRTITQSN